MTKLSQIKKALEENPEIIIIAAKDINYLPGKDGFFSHTVDFFVAPRTGTISTAEELQTLMMSLIPEIKPTSVDNFREETDYMYLGKLYFDECIGTRAAQVNIVLIDRDMFSTEGFVDGIFNQGGTEDVKRRVWVRLYPNVRTAMLSAEKGIDQFVISRNKLNKFKKLEKGRFSKFFT